MNRRPLSAIVLAAGEGTRMRSGDAEAVAPVVRSPDGPARAGRARRADRRAGGGRRRARCAGGQQDHPGRGSPRPGHRVRRAARTAWHGRRRRGRSHGIPRRLRRRPRRRRRHRAAGRHAAAAAGDAGRPSSTPTGRAKAPRRCSPRGWSSRPAARASSATRTAGWRASSTSTTPATTSG